MDKELETLVETAAARPVPRAVSAMADRVRADHEGAEAVLAYGSSLRGEGLEDTLIDFYVLTKDFEGVSANPLSRLGCRLVPPNVYYAEMPFEGMRLRAKYAVLPLSRFAGRMARGESNPYFWARFAQAPALVWSAGPGSRTATIAALAIATRTMFSNALGVRKEPASDIWEAGFRETYRTELRSEGPDRARELVAANREFYESAAGLLAGEPPVKANWPLRRFNGKLLSVARLFKAAFTFQGGADYAAWKIAKHSGVKIEVTDWQRRHPVLAGILLLPKLLRSRALR
jgi:hypothetical protein